MYTFIQRLEVRVCYDAMSEGKGADYSKWPFLSGNVPDWNASKTEINPSSGIPDFHLPEDPFYSGLFANIRDAVTVGVIRATSTSQKIKEVTGLDRL